MDINYIDIGIIVFIVITALVGLGRGFVWMAMFLISFVGSLALAFMFHDELMGMLPFQLSSEVGQMIVAGLIIFLVALFIGTTLNYLLSKAVHAIGLGGLDRILGACLGIAISGLIIALAVMFVNLTNYTQDPMWQSSILAPKFIDAATWLQENVPAHLEGLMNKVGIELPEIPTQS